MPHEHWLVTGAAGQLGGHLLHRLASVGATHVVALGSPRTPGAPGAVLQPCDLADGDALRATVAAARPTHILHIGALTAVGDCFARPADAQRINVDAARALAEAAADCGARLVFSSTDMVFDGTAAPYAEDAAPAPLSCYGRSKCAAERLLAGFPNTLVVRIPLLYGLPFTPRATTFVQQLAALRSRTPQKLFADEFRTPLWLADAARALVGLARSARTGVLHIAGPQRLSRFDLLTRCAALLGVADAPLAPISRSDIPTPEPRPADLALDAGRFAREFPALAPEPLRRAHLEAPAG